MTRSRPLFRLAPLLLTLGLLAALLGCSRSSENSAENKGSTDAAPAKVKLVLNWVPEPEFGGFYAAREGGAFKRTGLDVEIAGGGAGVPVVQMVASGKAEFGISGADEVLTARARGADVIPIFAAFQTSPQAIMVHASSGAKSLADVFASGTIALEPGPPYVAFLKKKFGFDKVKIVPYDGGIARFIAEKDFAQQCFITSEPLAATKKGSDPKVFLVAEEGFNPYVTVVITSRAFWKDKPSLVKAFARASREGWQAYLDDPGPSNAVMGKLNTSMDAETFSAAAKAQRPLVETEETKKGKLGMMTKERWEAMGKQLVELGVLEKAPNVDEYLVPVE